MVEKPLQYESLKAVLQYMDANVRLQASRCMPSIRKTEQKVPLKIDDLYFQHMKTVLNGSSYQLSVSRHYPKGTIQLAKEYSYDVDRYGFDVDFCETTDGDLDLRYLSEVTDRDNDGDEKRMRWELQPLKKRLKNVERELSKPAIRQERRAYLEKEKLEINKLVDAKSNNLLKFDLRNFNMDPPYTHFIKLTIGDHTEHLEYVDKKLCQAMKYLNTRLFESRNSILVNKLSRWDIGHVIHLPVGFKIRVRDINLTETGLNELQQILTESDIRTVTTNDISLRHPIIQISLLSHPIIQKSENLIIRAGNLREEQWLPILTTLKNRKVEWTCGMQRFPANVCIDLVKYWMNDGGRPIGTCYSFKVREERVALRVMEAARKEFEFVGEEADRSLSFFIDTTSVLNVSYRGGEQMSFWILSLEIKKSH